MLTFAPQPQSYFRSQMPSCIGQWPAMSHNGFVIQIIIKRSIHLITQKREANSNTYRSQGRQTNWMCIWREEGIKEERWDAGSTHSYYRGQLWKGRFYMKTFGSWMLETNANYLNLFIGQIILCELGGSLHLWSRWRRDNFLSLGEEQKMYITGFHKHSLNFVFL